MGMESLRQVAKGHVSPLAPCSQCEAAGCRWDRIVGQPYCPDCEETLAMGEGPAFVARTEKQHCVVCDKIGTVSFITFPLHAESPLEMDLCPEHFRALLARRLGPQAFAQLRRQLDNLGLAVEQIFLLHEVFYDDNGRALQPITDD
jgi:hypothetical protein